MPGLSEPNTIRILLATDNHVGYNERDPIRGDDSWKSFHEVMCLAKDHDVDMVLLAGDLFHENKPSRKSMYQVMRTLRMNCYGEKPCELEVLSDVSTNLQGTFNHVNYEDPDINVAIPVFSIHGNHDDPSGEGHLCALDILQVSGLLNYFGRTPENDNITVSPILLQKGTTKLALYGLSNVRDERLFRTFRDGKVKFLRPGAQIDEWFNLIAVHQNHQAHTETGYLPENFLQEFLDLVVWGHEHECLITPRVNPEMGFSVVQPGSSVATSLCAGESVAKHVGILSITGKDFEIEPIRLKSVRPFKMKEVVLYDSRAMQKIATKADNRSEVTNYLANIVEQMIVDAKQEWLQGQLEAGGEEVAEEDVPLPLIRLRVEYSATDGKFEVENPQRFSNRFVGRVANINDVVQFYRRKAAPIRRTREDGTVVEADSESILAQYGGKVENIRVENFVKEYLTSKSLNILPHNGLGNAVGQYIDKGDSHAVEEFLKDSLDTQFKKVLEYNVTDADGIREAMTIEKSKLEELYEKGDFKAKQRAAQRGKKQKPDDWFSDLDGEFVSDEGDVDMQDDDAEGETAATPPPAKTTRGRGGSKAAAPSRTAKGTTRAAAKAPAKALTKAPAKAPAKKAATTGRGRAKKSVISDEEEEEAADLLDDGEDDDVKMLDDDDLVVIGTDEEEVMPAKTTTRSGRQARAPAATKPAAKSAPAKRAPAKRAAAAPPKKQTTLSFSQRSTATRGTSKSQTAEVAGDTIEDSDDESDDFAPASMSSRRR
ncbi:meiotic recombination [Orbilia oligospora]|nr:meiotic recombination [Orbilia oligospora]KAF3241528.1 meiotic recombination [Orbilia oligospora]KAF3249316.1 meiotic recombination [Orbilia oligospora]KAF3296391.1 meiotic recombination [Orbilia oligospora]